MAKNVEKIKEENECEKDDKKKLQPLLTRS